MPWTVAMRFLAGAVLLFAAAYTLSEAAAPIYPAGRKRAELRRARGGEVEVVAAGNSHSRAIDFEAMGLRGFHLWSGGEDPLETEYVLRDALPELPRLRHALVTVSPESLGLDNGAATRPDRSDMRRAMYARTRVLGPLPGDVKNYVHAKLAPVARQDHWRGVARALLEGGRRPVEVRPDGGIYPPELAVRSEAELVESTAPELARQEALLRRVEASAPGAEARAVAALDALATRLLQRGVTPVFYSAPVFHAYAAARPPGRVEAFRAVMAALVARHPGAVWLDFSEEPAFARTSALFSDVHHLNATGARAFSSRLGDCLRALPRQAAGCGRPALPGAGPASGLPAVAPRAAP
jgi:hypothetical protein